MAGSFSIAGRYEVVAPIGAGAAATVYEVTDRETGRRLALKLLRPEGMADPASLVRAFHREFSLLTELRHPHLVAVHDFGTARPPGEPEAPELPYFTMDLVAGQPAARLRFGESRWSDLARIADAVLDALGALHDRGLVHRDVTASNILVGADLDDEPPPVWLMDLGLVDRARDIGDGVVRGTLATVAPETLHGGRLDGRADLYSLGCVLFRLATGRDPFTGATPWELLRAHLRESVPDPRTLVPGLPDSLAELILRLMAKDPADRPATAGEVREALAPLSGRRPDRAPPLRRPLAPAFCGRRELMERFEAALERVKSGAGEAWMVMGPGGSGRSRLLGEFRLAARLAGVEAVLVRSDEAPRRPLGLAGRIAAAVTPSGGDAAIEEVLSRRTAPLVLLADDVDRADHASREKLVWLARAAGASLPCLVVITARPSDPLESAAPWTHLVSLPPLDADAVARMAASMLGRPSLPAEWGRALAERTGGIPLLVEETVEALVRAGRVGREPAGPPEKILAELGEPGTRSREWLQSSWDRLGDGGRAILAALAVAAEPLRPADLEALDPRLARSATQLDDLIEAGLVRRVRTPDGSMAFLLAAPALAPEILALSDARTVRTLHRRWAERLADRPEAKGQRALHLLDAGETEQALPLLAAAIREAVSGGAPLEAIRLADRWLAEPSGSSSPDEAAVRQARAEALAAAGRLAEAEEEFALAERSARAAGPPGTLAAVLCAAGAFYARRGEVDRGLAMLEESLALFDELGETRSGALALVEIGETLERRGLAREAEARLLSALSQARRSGDGDLAARAGIGLGRLALAGGNEGAAIERFREAESEAGQADLRGAAARGRLLALLTAGETGEAVELGRRLVEEARRAGDLAAEAASRTCLARALAGSGRRSEAIQELLAGERLWTHLGQESERLSSAAFRAGILLELGRVRSAEELATGTRDAARAAKAGSALAASERVLARVLAFVGRAQEISWDTLIGAERRSLEGWVHLRAGRPEKAREAFQEAVFLARRDGAPQVERDALCGLAEVCLAVRDDDRLRLALRRLERAAHGRRDPELDALVRLLAAERELQRPDGDLKRAVEEARAAGEALERAERGDWAWRAWGALAAAARRLGDASAASEAARRARAGLEALLGAMDRADRERFRSQLRARNVLEQEAASSRTVAPPPSVPAAGSRRVEALERLLEINRALNSTLELDAVLRTLLDTAVELTGAERGFVLLEEGGETSTELARGAGGEDLAGPDRELSRSVARRTMEDRRALLVHDALSDARLSRVASVHALRLRSVLSVPLSVRGRVVGAIVLDSRRASALFDAEHVRLLSLLADQAGIAIGNARLVAELRRQAEEIRRLNERLQETVEEQRVELLEKQSNLEVRFRYDCIVGASPAMQKVYRTLDKLVHTEIPVLVTGESGTGKDLVARVLHYNGPRAKKRFVTVNCAALTDTLLESELFGHRRGAFTGADRDRKGLFEQADGGTLFLDEIGEMPLALQPKLLRAIQFGEIRRVGEDAPRHVDVRIVAATNRDLATMVREGRFREDLFYRLDVGRVHLAPLRERMEDIGLLVEHFLQQQAAKEGRRPRSIEPAALRLFLRYDWPGNVRELENEVTRLAAFTEGDVITEVDVLENALFLERARERRAPAPVGTLEQTELEQIRQALRAAGGNRTRAARMLGIDRSTLYRKIRKYGEQLGLR